jgi:hypothetical protein
MADHTIHFSPEQSLLLDKLLADKAELEKQVEKLEKDLEKANERNEIMRTNVAYADRKRREAEEANEAPGEEEIRQSERERIALWFDARGIEEQEFYDLWGNGVSVAAGEMAEAIRNKRHYRTYRESRVESDENWPDDYAMKPEDFDFNVDARLWERNDAE